MGLDICFKQMKKNCCPHCGEFIDYKEVACEDSGGRAWYPLLESIGYYVPIEERTEENDWYGKDMVLTAEQVKKAFELVRGDDVYSVYNYHAIKVLIATALFDGDYIAVNADW